MAGNMEKGGTWPVEGSLEAQLPDYFKPVIEFQEIIKAHSYAIGELEGNMAKLRANFYIPTCDEDTAAYYEKLFGIVYRFGDTLEFRRARILQKYNTIAPFSIGFLKDRLAELFGTEGYALEMDPLALELKIKVTSDRYGAVDLLYDLLWDIVPAHIRIIANQQATAYVSGPLCAAGFVSGTYIQAI